MAKSQTADQFLFGTDASDENQNQLAALGLNLAKKRDEAVQARKDSGIEDVWVACEEAYLAIDDSNRGEAGKWTKPTSTTGGLTKSTSKEKTSSAFVRLTSRYVDMGAAKVCEILLPIDDKAFSLSATPVPELVLQLDNSSQAIHPVTSQPMMRAAAPDEMATQQPAGQSLPTAGQPVPQVPLTHSDIAQKLIEQAQACAEKAETRIYDWMVEGKYPSVMRKLMHDSSRIGVGVLKAPTPMMQKSKAMVKTPNGIALEFKSKVVPSLKWIDPWNLFPHGACGENINNGDHIFERDFLAAAQLKELKKDQTYIAENIDKVLEEGPGKCLKDGINPAEVKNKDRYEVWYFTGTIKRSDMMLTKAIGVDELPDEVNDVYAICMLINDTVVQAIINPMQSGSFNYHAMPWSRRAGHWAGVGVAEQVSMPQRMVNAGTRALLNNAGLSGGLQIVIDQLAVIPANGDPTITPNKIWYKTADSTVDDVRKAFLAIEFPNVGAQMMNVINYAFKLAEEACNIPLISQGQTGPTTPDTFGATELQNNNANTLLRHIGLTVDDYITEPVVNGFYEWLLLDPEIPDDEKGDFKINAKGSIAMVEKAIQEQTMAQIGQMTLNPAFRADPKKWFAEFIKTKRLDPRKIQYTEAEQRKMDSAPPQPPIQLQVEQAKGQNALQVAQAKVQGEMQLAQQEMQAEQQLLQNGGTTPHMAAASARVEDARIRAASLQAIEASRSQTELAYAQSEAQMARDNANARLQELQMKRDLALLDYTSKHNLTLEQAKADLAKTAIIERTKRELAAAELQMRQSENDKSRTHEVNLKNAETTSAQLANE